MQVIDSRAKRNGSVVRRRRQCIDCEHRTTTIEISMEEYQEHLESAKKLDKIKQSILS